jgi:hypothetical protein
MASQSIRIGDVVITALRDRAPTAAIVEVVVAFPTVSSEAWAP